MRPKRNLVFLPCCCSWELDAHQNCALRVQRFEADQWEGHFLTRLKNEVSHRNKWWNQPEDHLVRTDNVQTSGLAKKWLRSEATFDLSGQSNGHNKYCLEILWPWTLMVMSSWQRPSISKFHVGSRWRARFKNATSFVDLQTSDGELPSMLFKATT